MKKIEYLKMWAPARRCSDMSAFIRWQQNRIVTRDRNVVARTGTRGCEHAMDVCTSEFTVHMLFRDYDAMHTITVQTEVLGENRRCTRQKDGR